MENHPDHEFKWICGKQKRKKHSNNCADNFVREWWLCERVSLQCFSIRKIVCCEELDSNEFAKFTEYSLKFKIFRFEIDFFFYIASIYTFRSRFDRTNVELNEGIDNLMIAYKSNSLRFISTYFSQSPNLQTCKAIDDNRKGAAISHFYFLFVFWMDQIHEKCFKKWIH